MEITLKFTAQEIKALFEILGQLPTNTGVYPLMVKIKEQADAQQSNEVDNS